MSAPLFYVSCLGGLEHVAAAELQARVPAVEITAREFGRVHFCHAGPVAPLLALRTIEHVHAYVQVLEGVRPGQDWLQDLEDALAATDLGPALELLRQVAPVPDPPRFRVTGFRYGKHEYGSMDVAGWAGAGIVTRYGWPVDLKHADLDVRIEVRDDRALIGVRLSPEPLHHRSRIVHMRASLNPTLAAAMVWLSEPTPGELVLDPMCGAGTILTERHHHDPAVTLVASDLFAEKLDMARTNFRHFTVPVALLQADAQDLPVRTGVVDKVICNLPWGRIVANPRINRRLYPRLLAEIARVLRPGGRALLLTSERNLAQKALNGEPNLRLERQFHVHVGGLEPTLYLTHRV